MARRNDLAGLAALGALGMVLSKRQDGSSVPVEDRGTSALTSGGRDTRDYGVDYSEAPQRGRDFMTEKEPDWESSTGNGRRPASGGRTPSKPASDSRPYGGPRRGPAFENGSAGQKGPGFGEEEAYLRNRPVTGNPGGSYDAELPKRRLNSAEAMAQLDRQLGYREGPTAGNGNSVDSTELSRNLSAMVNAGGPGGLAKAARAGLGVAREFGPASAAQKAYNQAQAARRAAEGFSPAEAQAAREAAELAARDAKVLNPNAWLAGPQGMKNFKKGGLVGKKTAAPMKMSASSRGDGIAQRGKTRGKMR